MGLLDGLKDLRPPGADLALLALLLAANALTGGEFGGIDISGSDLHITEIGLAVVLFLAIWRLRPSGAWRVFRERSAPIWIGLFMLAALVAMARGLTEFNAGAVLYDVQLYFFVVTVPVVVLCADTRERALWLLKAVVVIAAVATLMVLAFELVSRAFDAESPLGDQEGEIGAGGFYACFTVAWVLAGLALGRFVTWPAVALGCAAIAMIGVSEKRTAWVALAAMMIALVPLAWRARRIVLPTLAGVVALAAGLTIAIDATAGSKASNVVEGPLEGEFEAPGETGWRALGTADPTGPFLSRDWSAAGRASLGVRFEASENLATGYLFARSCCLADGGLDADPGTRYRISAVIRAEESPAKGVRMGVVFFADDGTYQRPPAKYAPARVRTGQTKTLRIAATAPPKGEVIGLTIGPLAYREGDVGEFFIDRVKVEAAGVAGNVSTTGDGSEMESGSQLGSEVEGFLGGESEEGQNVEWRLDFWSELLERLGEDPVKLIAGAGMGPAEFVRDDRGYDFRLPESSYANNTTGPHNVFIAVLYMTGVIGVVALLGILATAVLALVRGLRDADEQRRRALVALALMSVTGLVFALLSESPRAPELTTFSWTAVGLILALAPSARPGDAAAQSD